jgi:hypothetical protein
MLLSIRKLLGLFLVALPLSASAISIIDLTARAEQADDNGAVKVLLHWQSPDPEMAFEIVRERIDGVGSPEVLPILWEFGEPGLGPKQGIDQSFIDTKVHPFTSYRYKVFQLEKIDPSNVLESVEISIEGNELIIKGEQKLSGLKFNNPPIHRLKFEPGSVLLTEGKKLVLNLIELVSDKGAIMSFHKDAVASPQKPGRHGGLIQITTQRAEGDIQIIGRGEKGGIGKTGNRGDAGLKGDRGEFAAYRLQFDPDSRTRIATCTRGPGDGKRGKPGKSGEKGGDGAHGGNSSQIKIKIIEPTSLIVKAKAISGQGGHGGKGGKGGKGGPGGDQGRPNDICAHWAQKGPNGSKGAQGAPGNKGPNGKKIIPVLKFDKI